MTTNKIVCFDPILGEFVYEWHELPPEWDMTDEERWELYREALASIGWSDCRW